MDALKLTLLIFLTHFAGNGLSKSSSLEQISLEDLSLNLKKAPSNEEWRFFLNTSSKWKESVWKKLRQENNKFSQWTWGWKLAWLRSCIKKKLSYCQKIVNWSINDPALVIRSMAVNILGQNYARSNHQEVIDILSREYLKKRNLNNNKPTFIHKRILWALQNIGGEQSLKEALHLSNKYKSTQTYWSYLSKSKEAKTENK